jgi:hypothetical protein
MTYQIHLPEEVDVDQIAEDASQAGFAAIAAGFDRAGYPITGDVDPLESQRIDQTFRGWVRMMAVNNPNLCTANDLYWSEEITVEIEAADPGELLARPSEVFVRRESRGSSGGDLVTLHGPRYAVRKLIAENWGEDEAAYRVDGAREPSRYQGVPTLSRQGIPT